MIAKGFDEALCNAALFHAGETNLDHFLPDQKNFFQFKKDLKAKRAIKRNVEIIGEAANRIIKKQPDIKITDIKKIIDTPNRIIHGYDNVSDDVIWLLLLNIYLN
ncbi:HepT-like ribonuclease domain-containing protein [Mucilaginibacter sp.]|uniref:HepT-like ribonuclease domain-containing protein n=1 Tax=Mucilaginibacter sp. TaxID=1882438 RepID=UPI0026033ACF|nr:HepT-like ribonuclease domain-containing protein [Mucilaginibacter sp.]